MKRRKISANKTTLESIAFAAIIFLTIFANYATATLYPLVWLDEVMYSDPVIHLLRGTGFTSTAWYSVTFDHFWYGNTPLHQLVLALWGKTFGLRLESVRVFGHVLAALSVVLVWLSLQRLIPKSTIVKFLIVVALLTEHAVAFAYRSGRPDTVCFVVASLLLYSSTIESLRTRHIVLASSATLVPWAGLQLVVALVFASGILWIMNRDRRRDIFVMGAGMAIGAIALATFYAVNDSLWQFLNATFISMHTIIGQTGRYVLLGDQRLLDRIQTLVTAVGNPITQDPSQIILLATIAILTVLCRHDLTYRYGLRALGIGIVFPLYMALAGKYPLYYAWMGFVLVLFACLPLLVQSMRHRWSALVAIIGFSAVAVVGLPLNLIIAVHEREMRDYSAVRQYIERNVSPGEWVYATSPAYFAAVEQGAFVLSGSYTGSRLSPEIPPEQRDRVTTIIASPVDFSKVQELVGGNWQRVADTLRTGDDHGRRDPHDLDRVYYLQVYRRVPK